jgi:OOP family OmpA-OmpF porin
LGLENCSLKLIFYNKKEETMRLIKTTLLIGSLVFFVAMSGICIAEIESGSVFISPFVGGFNFEGNRDYEDGPTYGIGVGYNFDERWSAEAVFNFVESELERKGGDLDTYIYRLDGLYHFMPSQKIVPYIGAGVGLMTADRERRSTDNDPIVNYGAGLKFFFNKAVALRADVRHIISFDDTYNDLVYTIGLSFNLGGDKKTQIKDRDNDGVYDDMDKCPDTPHGIEVDSVGCPLDSDRDGVYDYIDKCPGTPAGVAVDSAGCPPDSDRDGVYDYKDKCPGTPAGVAVDSAGCPPDSDRDGVYDYIDKCPGTPAGVAVDSAGCPLDSDRDGVYDYKDKCPGTPAGLKVDSRGCCVIKGVHFDSEKWDIKPEYYPILDEVVAILAKNPNLKVEIEGHTDNRGFLEFNQKLSENRAKAIMEYFIKEGINPKRLSAKGFGPSQPIDTNNSPEGRAKNRRVELKPIF